MNARSKAVLGYVVGWLITICFVVLFTLIFSFVGTLICAALAGMMMGAARLRWWQSFTVSLVFPAVASITFCVTRATLPAGKIALISTLCFAVFWVIYFALWGLTSHEHAQAAAARRVPAPAQPRGRQQAQALVQPAGPMCGTPPLNAMSTAGPELNLQMLQGTWLARNGSPEHSHVRKAIEISEDSLVVRLTDGDGRVQCLATGRVRICPGCILAVIEPQGELPDPAAQVCI